MTMQIASSSTIVRYDDPGIREDLREFLAASRLRYVEEKCGCCPHTYLTKPTFFKVTRDASGIWVVPVCSSCQMKDEDRRMKRKMMEVQGR